MVEYGIMPSSEFCGIHGSGQSSRPWSPGRQEMMMSVAKGSEEVKDVVMTYICVLLARITRSFTLQCFHKVHHWSYVK